MILREFQSALRFHGPATGRGLVAARAEERGISTDQAEDEYLRYISMRCWIDPAEVGDLVAGELA